MGLARARVRARVGLGLGFIRLLAILTDLLELLGQLGRLLLQRRGGGRAALLGRVYLAGVGVRVQGSGFRV